MSFARGHKRVELLVKNVKIVNVFSEEIHQTDVDIIDGIFVGFGGKGYNTKNLYDAQGRCMFWDL
jgi:adenine deaminase